MNEASSRKIFLVMIVFCFSVLLLFVQIRKLMPPHSINTNVTNVVSQQATVNDRLARERIMQFIEKSRSILGSRFAQKNAIDSAYSMMLPNSDAYAYLGAWYSQYNPFMSAVHETDQVQVRTIQAIIPNVYRVQWSEHIRDKRGKLIEFQVWEGTVSVAQPSALIYTIMWWIKNDIHYGKVRSKSIVTEPGITLPKSDWTSASLSSKKAQLITDALGTHIIPLGFQEKPGDPHLLFRSLGMSVATMQNSSSGTQIMLLGMKNTSAPAPETPLLSSQLRYCSSITPLPNDAFKVRDVLLSFQRFSCRGSESSHGMQMETETGNFLVRSPMPHRIVFVALGLQQTWNSSANAIHELVRSFH
jgi:VirB8 protein